MGVDGWVKFLQEAASNPQSGGYVKDSRATGRAGSYFSKAFLF
jgi:hypothetical protein